MPKLNKTTALRKSLQLLLRALMMEKRLILSNYFAVRMVLPKRKQQLPHQ
jgi:hypothetical protein